MKYALLMVLFVTSALSASPPVSWSPDDSDDGNPLTTGEWFDLNPELGGFFEYADGGYQFGESYTRMEVYHFFSIGQDIQLDSHESSIYEWRTAWSLSAGNYWVGINDSDKSLMLNIEHLPGVGSPMTISLGDQTIYFPGEPDNDGIWRMTVRKYGQSHVTVTMWNEETPLSTQQEILNVDYNDLLPAGDYPETSMLVILDDNAIIGSFQYKYRLGATQFVSPCVVGIPALMNPGFDVISVLQMWGLSCEDLQHVTETVQAVH